MDAELDVMETGVGVLATDADVVEIEVTATELGSGTTELASADDADVVATEVTATELGSGATELAPADDAGGLEPDEPPPPPHPCNNRSPHNKGRLTPEKTCFTIIFKAHFNY